MKRFLFFLFLVGCWLLHPLQVYAKQVDIQAKHVLAIELSTGKILYEKDADTPANIASISKLLSAYLVYEAVERGQLTWETVVPISDYSFQLTEEELVSNVNLENRSYTVRELLEASLLSSANSATIALAEAVAGSEPAFVDQMRQKMQDWGLSDATIVNATGLSNEFLEDNRYPNSAPTDENKLSARDVARITQHLLLDYPQVLDITAQASYSFGGETYDNTNPLVSNGRLERTGVDGLKTGTSNQGQLSLVATATEGTMRLVTVVLDANHSAENPDNRFVQTQQLLDYLYQTYELKTLTAAGRNFPNGSLSISQGEKNSLSLLPKTDMPVVVQKSRQTEPKAQLELVKSQLTAPVQKGQILGKWVFTDPDLIGQGYLGAPPSTEAIAAQTIPKAPLPWWQQFLQKLPFF